MLDRTDELIVGEVVAEVARLGFAGHCESWYVEIYDDGITTVIDEQLFGVFVESLKCFLERNSWSSCRKDIRVVYGKDKALEDSSFATVKIGENFAISTHCAARRHGCSMTKAAFLLLVSVLTTLRCLLDQNLGVYQDCYESLLGILDGQGDVDLEEESQGVYSFVCRYIFDVDYEVEDYAYIVCKVREEAHYWKEEFWCTVNTLTQ